MSQDNSQENNSKLLNGNSIDNTLRESIILVGGVFITFSLAVGVHTINKRIYESNLMYKTMPAFAIADSVYHVQRNQFSDEKLRIVDSLSNANAPPSEWDKAGKYLNEKQSAIRKDYEVLWDSLKNEYAKIKNK